MLVSQYKIAFSPKLLDKHKIRKVVLDNQLNFLPNNSKNQKRENSQNLKNGVKRDHGNKQRLASNQVVSIALNQE